MSSFRLASRYSKSLLQLAQERNALETVYTEVVGIHALTAGSKELRLLLKKKQHIYNYNLLVTVLYCMKTLLYSIHLGTVSIKEKIIQL